MLTKKTLSKVNLLIQGICESYIDANQKGMPADPEELNALSSLISAVGFAVPNEDV